jgi:hypothetical protein
MKAVLLAIAAATIMLGTMASIVWLASHGPRPPRDHLCPVAEISPDITPAERERCRQLRAIKL